jgi:Alpha/beta hydrolase domain
MARSLCTIRIATRLSSVLLVFALFVMAGCGRDDGSGGNGVATATSTPPSTSTATPAASDTSTATATATRTATPSLSPTRAPTDTATPTPSATETATQTETPTPSPTETPTVPNPAVEGPITTPGAPLIQASSFDLADVGYSQQEFFISGTARAYTNAAELDSDGAWLAIPAGTTAAYKTRIIVYRPIADADFHGSVVVEWLNVSGGLDAAPDWTAMHTELIREGYAWVGVSAQFVGVEGGVSPIPGLNLSLKGANPARYGSLHHPGDSFSYDIYSQAGQAVRNPVGIDVLGGLQPQRVIAVGESQSAFRFVTYVNAIHPTVGLYDGFLIHSRGGGGAPLSQTPQASIPVPSPARIRGDLDVPVLTFETETDLISLGFLPDRQPDAPLFRLWEVAGTSHADTYTLGVGFTDEGNDPSVADVLTDFTSVFGVINCNSPINSGPQHFVLNAAIHALERWIRDGEAPPTAPRLEVEGSPAQYVLDDLGNVSGGIRTPWVDAPVAKLSGLGQSGGSFCGIFGTTVGFDAETLAALYPDHDTYVATISDATDAAVTAGFILAPDGDLIKAAAAASDIGNQP